jgi:flagellar biogenesis protein FliO
MISRMEKMKKWLAKFSKKQIIAIVLSSIIVIIFIVLPMFYIVKEIINRLEWSQFGLWDWNTWRLLIKRWNLW